MLFLSTVGIISKSVLPFEIYNVKFFIVGKIKGEYCLILAKEYFFINWESLSS